MPGNNVQDVAWALVTFAAGVPSIAQQDGSFDSVTANGAGDVTLNLKSGFGIDSTQCGWATQVSGALAASQLTSFGLVHTSDEAKRITILQEGAMGAASALTDVNFVITFFKLYSI